MSEYSKWSDGTRDEESGRDVVPLVLSKLRQGARAYRQDERGTVAILFGLTAFVVLALIGGAVDFGRAITVKEQLQRAVDAASLAAARVWQTENDLAAAEARGQQFFEKNKPYGVTSSMTFASDPVGNSITMEAQAQVPAPFLTGAGTIVRPLGVGVEFDYIPVSAHSQALLAVGGNAETNLEISMMLDVTGSMAGSKIEDLKAAAKDLIDIVVWEDQSEYTSKVALVPFANGVNLGSTALVNSVRGALKTGSCTSSGSPCTAYTSGSPSSTQWTVGAPAAYYRFTNTGGGSTTWRPSSYCVTERIGAQRYTDAAPNTAANKVMPLYFSSSSSEDSRCSVLNTADLEINAITPLSSDKTELKQRIDKMELAGATAGQLGTAWAWYMLSPNWGYLWPSDANRPKPYFTEKTQKIAILMTDGEYNTAHCNGVLSSNSSANGNTRINCNANNANADTQADNLCSAMKTGTGITVYVVGFALGGNSTAINTLRACASDETKFYEAEDGEALRLAFRDIALQIAKLRLSQ